MKGTQHTNSTPCHANYRYCLSNQLETTSQESATTYPYEEENAPFLVLGCMHVTPLHRMCAQASLQHLWPKRRQLETLVWRRRAQISTQQRGESSKKKAATRLKHMSRTLTCQGHKDASKRRSYAHTLVMFVTLTGKDCSFASTGCTAVPISYTYTRTCTTCW